MKERLNIPYGESEYHLLNLYLPEGTFDDLLIWFHGGGLESGDRTSLLFAEELTAAGVAIASVEYRLYPNARFPEFIEDCARGVRFILDHIPAKRYFISGQSAGAYIALMLAFDRQYLNAAGIGRQRIAGFIADSAQTTTHFNVLRERDIDPRLERIDDASPMYHLSEHSYFGNLLLICYTEDMLCRPEQNRLFYQSIRRLCPEQNVQLVELPGPHCYGSCCKNERGTFDFNDVFLKFINSSVV